MERIARLERVYDAPAAATRIRIYLAKNELPHAREKLMAHFLFAN